MGRDKSHSNGAPRERKVNVEARTRQGVLSVQGQAGFWFCVAGVLLHLNPSARLGLRGGCSL